MSIVNDIIFSLKKIQENTELFAPNEDKAAVIAKYSEDEKAIILRFLNDINSLMDNNFRNF